MADVIGTLNGDTIQFSETIIGHVIMPQVDSLEFVESGFPNMYVASDSIQLKEEIFGFVKGSNLKTLFISDERYFQAQPITPIVLTENPTQSDQ